MNNFTLSNAVDKDNVFMVNLSEIEGRIDPVMLRYQRKINKFKYNASKIKNLLVQNPQYGANEAGIERTSYKSPRYIRITDINEFGELNNSIGKTAEVIEHKYYLKNNDILIARSGNTVGKAYIHKTKNIDYDCFFAGYMIRFKFNEEKVLSEYIFVTTQLSFYKDWLNSIKRLAGQPNVNAEEYKNLKIPLPSLEIQNKIINLYEKANKSKQKKEDESEKLLNSIDDYLLNELRITLPEKDNSLQNRIFTTSLSKVCGGRFDPFYFMYCIESPKSENYKEVLLKEVASIVKGQSITSANIEEGEFPVIAGGQTSPYFHNVYNHSGNVITISASGAYSGFAWYHTTPIFASDCSVVQSKDEKICNTEYLYNVLKLKQEELYNMQQGSGQPHVYPSDIYKIGIPLPKIKKQLEINEHITQIRNKAKQLQKEAVTELEKAKQEVEKMILGDGGENE